MKAEKSYLQGTGLGGKASTGATHPEISKYTLIAEWGMCYERGVHRLLQKQGRVLSNRDWSTEAIVREFFTNKVMLDESARIH